MFIQASNQLGAVESGIAAAAFGATFAVVSGGAAAIAVAGAIGWRVQSLYNHVTPRRGAGTPAATEEAAGAAGGSG